MEILADKAMVITHTLTTSLNRARYWSMSLAEHLFTIAKDVKLQIEFNPAKVKAYRLIGYENRM
jgi:Ca-activated chloride channel family protein